MRVRISGKMTNHNGISGKMTNHNARQTMITKLVQNDMNPLHVAQLTGYKNLKSLQWHLKNKVCHI